MGWVILQRLQWRSCFLNLFALLSITLSWFKLTTSVVFMHLVGVGCYRASSWNCEECKSSALQSTWHAVCSSPAKHLPVIASPSPPQKQLRTCQLRSAAAHAECSAAVDVACTRAQSHSWAAVILQSEGGSNPQQTREEKRNKADEQEGLQCRVCWEWCSVSKEIWMAGEPETGGWLPVLSAERRFLEPV